MEKSTVSITATVTLNLGDDDTEEAYQRRRAAQRERIRLVREAEAVIGAHLRDEKDTMFRLMEEVEKISVNPADPKSWEFLAKSAGQLTATKHFEDYPNWRARAWRLSADMHAALKDAAGELECLQAAIALNPKLAVKRRIKALSKQ